MCGCNNPYLKVDWNHVPANINSVAIDSDGKCFGYSEYPEFNANHNHWQWRGRPHDHVAITAICTVRQLATGDYYWLKPSALVSMSGTLEKAYQLIVHRPCKACQNELVD